MEFHLQLYMTFNFFYRAMHYSAKRGLAIACRSSVCLSVCNVGGLGSHKLEILETNCTDNYRNTFALEAQSHPPTPTGTWGNFGEIRDGVGKSGVLEHKSGNISLLV